MTNTLNFGHVAGLTAAEQQQLSDLAEAYTYHQSHNATKDKYYEGHVTLRDVNLGIALPLGLRGLEVGCSWGQKAVDVLAARSMFDGFVGTGGSLLVGRLMFKMTIFPAVWITLCAFTLSVALGILFGIYPAVKASKLQPVEALRAE